VILWCNPHGLYFLKPLNLPPQWRWVIWIAQSRMLSHICSQQYRFPSPCCSLGVVSQRIELRFLWLSQIYWSTQNGFVISCAPWWVFQMIRLLLQKRLTCLVLPSHHFSRKKACRFWCAVGFWARFRTVSQFQWHQLSTYLSLDKE